MPARKRVPQRSGRSSRAAARADLVADLLGDLDDPQPRRPRRVQTARRNTPAPEAPSENSIALSGKLDAIELHLREIHALIKNVVEKADRHASRSASKRRRV